MNELRFENLPEQVNLLRREILELKVHFGKIVSTNPQGNVKPMGIDQACEFLAVAKSTLYSKCSRKEIPYIKQCGKLYFLESDLIDYLNQGRIKSLGELDSEVHFSLNKKGGDK